MHVVSYCSEGCRKAARSLHSMECIGMSKLEKLRGKETLDVVKHIDGHCSFPENYERLWPPCHALLVARILNKGILEGKDWIAFVDSANVNCLSPVKSRVFPQLEKYVRLLTPTKITDEEIKKAFRMIGSNAGTDLPYSTVTYIVAVYNPEFTTVKHSCMPNSIVDFEKDGSAVLYTIEDVNVGEEIVTSFVPREYYINIREFRRAELQERFGLNCQCSKCQGEMVVGSRLWQLEARKSALIAPWSKAMAK